MIKKLIPTLFLICLLGTACTEKDMAQIDNPQQAFDSLKEDIEKEMKQDPDKKTGEKPSENKEKNKDPFEDDLVNQAKMADAKLQKPHQINDEISGDDLNIFKHELVLSYTIKNTDIGLTNSKTLYEEEKDSLGNIFKPQFYAFWDTLAHYKMTMKERIESDLDLQKVIKKDDRYIYIHYFATNGQRSYVGEIAVGNSGIVLCKVNDYEKPNEMIGPSGVYQSDPALFTQLEKFMEEDK